MNLSNAIAACWSVADWQRGGSPSGTSYEPARSKITAKPRSGFWKRAADEAAISSRQEPSASRPPIALRCVPSLPACAAHHGTPAMARQILTRDYNEGGEFACSFPFGPAQSQESFAGAILSLGEDWNRDMVSARCCRDGGAEGPDS
jgi:hypothetical protein